MHSCRRRRSLCLNNLNNQDNNEYEKSCCHFRNNLDDFNQNLTCGFDEEDDGFPSNPMYAQSYVPIQIMNNTFMPASGLARGTIFPELVSPYCPGDSMAEIKYLENTNSTWGGRMR